MESAEGSPGLDISIVSYRCEALLRDCLASLREHPPSRPLSVHVVDNASGDGTAEMVEREFPDVRLTACDQNLGFSAANNIAISAGSAPYVLVLNPDTRVTPGSLDQMCELMDARSEVGTAGPRLVLEDGSFDHAAKRSFPTPLSAVGHLTGVGRRRESGRLAAYRAPEIESGPVDAVNGAFMLIRRAALDEVGLFDEGYWMYMEDLDLCYRLTEAGWVTWYEPSATVIHVKAGTAGPDRSVRLNRAFHYGMYRFYRKHYAADRNPLFNLIVYGGIAVALILSVVRTEARRSLRALRGTRG
jgi:N-acetylglucosaminyl-diphospho-decaprenol L-rhamnosyltransferase